MFTITVGDYAVTVQQGTIPTIYGDYKKHAKLAEEFALRPHVGELCFVSVSNNGRWPVLVVAQRFELAEAGFDPAALLVPETKTLFIGAGRRLLAYQLEPAKRIWEETVDSGFWEWGRHGEMILMSGELELAAYDLNGHKLWNLPVQPAWDYHFDRGQIHLDVLGRRTVFSAVEGPAHAAMEK
ncbi:MAG TPA: hypothetical protein VLJ39_05905 [Tepidisphaeraceae bacterium]|jgi:hypothetical protein|nr:hypothetical protein [Tepidisphaeraceae bacterium]